MMARYRSAVCYFLVAGALFFSVLAGADPVEIFTTGESGYEAFRIPGIIAAGKDTLLAVAEGRKYQQADFGNQHDVVAKRSIDNGQSWSPLIVVGDATLLFGCNKTLVFNSTTVGLCQFWDPTPVYDNTTGEIHLLAYYTNDVNETSRLQMTGDVFLWTSRDGGAQWSDTPRNLSHFFQIPRMTPANGHGIQLHHGSNRLVIPAYGKISADYNSSSGSCVLYSDDHGLTWAVTGEFGLDTAEGDVAELMDGSVLYTLRSDDPNIQSECFPYQHCMMSARSFDHGTTFENLIYQSALVDSGCKGGISSFVDDGTIVFVNSANAVARSDVTLRISRDEGRTWYGSQLIYDGKSGYVDVDTSVQGGQKYAHVVFEKAELSIMYAQLPVEAP
jgi:sialidase-1